MSFLLNTNRRVEGFERPPPECDIEKDAPFHPDAFDLYDWYWSKVKHFPKNWKERPEIKLEEENTVEATDGLRQAFEDLRETADKLAKSPLTDRALDWAPKAVRFAGSSHGHPVEEKQTAFNHVPDISTHVVINNEMKKQLIGDKLPDGRIEQIKFLLKRLTWREMEDVAKDIYQKLPAGEKPGDMARALIDWAHDVSG